MNLILPISIDPLPPTQAAERLARLAGPGPRTADSREELIQAAKDFESVLLDRLLQEMKRTIPESGLLGGQGSEQVWDLFWGQLARAVGSHGGLGLWKQLAGQLGANASPAVGPPPAQPPSESKP